jgi:hypothetical protein
MMRGIVKWAREKEGAGYMKAVLNGVRRHDRIPIRTVAMFLGLIILTEPAMRNLAPKQADHSPTRLILNYVRNHEVAD